MDSLINKIGVGFSIFAIFSIVMFVLVIGIILFVLIKGVKHWNKNNRSPRLTVPATVVAKRTEFSHRHRGTSSDMFESDTSTYYYVTFQVDSGDRMEFYVAGHEYGLLAEGDRGNLTFQGSRYLDFQRV